MAGADEAKGRLLAVDDSVDSADLVARVATRCGFDAQATSDPTVVRALVASWKPEVLTLDLCMPEADGIDLLSVLEETGFDGILIIISGQDGWFRKAASRLAETRGLKVVDGLQKPIDITALRDLLSGLKKKQ
ncbi:MAG TPA: response regulator [Stellaceae bacterium]|nr:response regulator [Stellaceae bacterium]